MIGWLFSKRRRRLKLLDVEAKVVQAQEDRDTAKEAQAEAHELAEWAERANRSNRFGLRLEAAWRLQTRQD